MVLGGPGGVSGPAVVPVQAVSTKALMIEASVRKRTAFIVVRTTTFGILAELWTPLSEREFPIIPQSSGPRECEWCRAAACRCARCRASVTEVQCRRE